MISKKNYLFYYGIGGSMMHNVKSMEITLNMKKFCKIGEARKLIVDYSQEYLRRINNNKKLLPYLDKYPFTYEDIKIDVSFSDKNANPPNDEYIVLSFLKDGYIYYFKSNPFSIRYDLIQSEPFEEAVKIVRGEPSK